MPETKRMAEEANRMGQEAQQQAKRVGQEFQKAAEGGVEQRGAHSVKSIKASRPLLPR